MIETIRGVDALTARWACETRPHSTVFTAAARWPLLGFLAAGAAEPVRSEPAEALDAPTDLAATRASALLRLLRELPDTEAAVG